MPNRLLQVADYVRYLGNPGVAGPLHTQGIGRIDGFVEQHGVERINLHLRDRETNIWCDHERVRSIETEEKHLIACGYESNMVGENRKRYIRGASVISRCSIGILQLQRLVLTGFCVADFTNVIDAAPYIKNDDFDLISFYQDFPWVNDLNSLFDFLKSGQLQLNWDDIAHL